MEIIKPDPATGFSAEDTQIVKGVAISLILFHHLFYPEAGFDMVTREIAYMSKSAVALFVFLSGFGLYRNYSGNMLSLTQFYRKKAMRIYVPYWISWAVFVPAGVFLFDISLSSVYRSDIPLKLIVNLLGVHIYFGFYGYNPTWWFVSLILGLYLLSPAVFYILDKAGIAALALSMLAFMVPFRSNLWLLAIYFFPFVLGAYAAKAGLVEKAANVIRDRRALKFIIYLSLIAVLFWQRQTGIFMGKFLDAPSPIDGPISLLMVLMCFEYLNRTRIPARVFGYIGKYTYYIFLNHTFIYYMYFRDFIYSFTYVPIIFTALLVISLVLSMGIMWIEQKIMGAVSTQTA